MPKVYRLETVEGKDIYQAEIRGLRDARSAFNDEDRHPLPSSDPKLRDWWINAHTDPFHFGFTSKAALKRWFHRWAVARAEFHLLGIVCNVYTVPEDSLKRGVAQCCFRKDGAELIGPLDPSQWV